MDDLLANKDVDVVINLTIPDAHYAVTRRILEAGKHAYSEKPLVLTLAEGVALRDLAAAKGLAVGCAPDTFLGGTHQQARALIDEGRLGTITTGNAAIQGHGPESWHPNPEFFYLPGAGPVMDMGPYYIANLINLLGPVRRVGALTSSATLTRTIPQIQGSGAASPVAGTVLLLGAVGSVAGIALGTGLAALALRLLGGDLGGGFFAGSAPSLQWDGAAALVYGLLGVVAAGVGGWWPARAAQRLPPAQTLKGLGAAPHAGMHRTLPLGLMGAAVLLAQTPPLFGIPLAAYVAVGLLLVGGITALPGLVALVYDRLAPRVAHRLLPLLAVERARRVRESAAVAVSGVVAALSLAVALTVMVASFRDSVTRWLDVVLPADLYVRSATGTGAADTVYFPTALVQAVARVPGVRQVGTQRTSALLLDPARPPVTLISRDLPDPAHDLALVGEALPVPAGQTGLWVSEAMVDLYGARLGSPFAPISEVFKAYPSVNRASSATFFIAGVWRDYARQSGAVAIDRRDYELLTGDRNVNDLALWLADGADPDQVQAAVRRAVQVQSGSAGLDAPLEFASASQIRATSLRIFDRSFAVTYWLQAVAIGIGLFGVAASFSAQVLARRKEFGLLAHLGLTRRQILAVVAGEGAAWTGMGALAGLGLGLAVSVVLVKVVNPQSFHWSMDLSAPWVRLLALCGAVVTAGTLTAWLAGRAAAGRDAVLAVKEDW